MLAKKSIPEIFEVESIAKEFKDLVEFNQLTIVNSHGFSIPLYSIEFGSKDPKAPVCFFTAGVHGIERVGTHVLISFLKYFLTKLTWDENLKEILGKIKFISIPIVNPIGMAITRRSNGNGVDLMRNCPVEAQGKTILGVSGQRFSNKLPWFRGDPSKLEQEVETIKNIFLEKIIQSPFVISLDLHSGFGIKDRLWYPWAKSSLPFPQSHNVLNLKKLFDKTYPYHIYKIEHQADSYMTHGDLWDYLYELYSIANPQGVFLPLTLEMGSWMWVKKNPWQIFLNGGIYNPVKTHRYARAMRRHLHLMDFLVSSSIHTSSWLNQNAR